MEVSFKTEANTLPLSYVPFGQSGKRGKVSPDNTSVMWPFPITRVVRQTRRKNPAITKEAKGNVGPKRQYHINADKKTKKKIIARSSGSPRRNWARLCGDCNLFDSDDVVITLVRLRIN